jgi:hypothetical protein
MHHAVLYQSDFLLGFQLSNEFTFRFEDSKPRLLENLLLYRGSRCLTMYPTVPVFSIRRLIICGVTSRLATY